MKSLRWLLPTIFLALLCVQCRPVGPPISYGPAPDSPGYGRSGPASGAGTGQGSLSVRALLRQVNLKQEMVRRGAYGRKDARPMRPRFITIHSTQNATAGAERHAEALRHGALRTGQRPGYLIWHFTVQDNMAIQHMPTTEQGIHADFDGPGNHYSIGIEMCENRGNNIPATVDRTAKLTAVLMKQYGIPLQNVVPHYHWPRKGKNPPNKNCPHFLMDNGRPGRKWQGFLQRVNSYYRRLQ